VRLERVLRDQAVEQVLRVVWLRAAHGAQYPKRVRRSVTALVVLSCAALVGLLAYGLASKGTSNAIDTALAKGQRIPAPRAVLPRLGAPGTASLADFSGKPVLLNFWASWCDPCRDELPLLEKTQGAFSSHGGTVLGINIKDFPEDALPMAREYHLTYPSLRDKQGEFGRDYGLTGYPESFLIDRRGRVAAARRGPLTQKWLDENLPKVL
jgi:cytochrome c biogenesis protein CcmG/thiol:disulfide interchange protein DsbE